MNGLDSTAFVILDRLRRAQAVAQVGSWELDLASRTLWASEEAFRVYGLPLAPEQMLPFPEVQTVPLSQYRHVLDRALGDLLSGRGGYDVEFEIRRPSDGSVRWIHSLAELDRSASRPGSVVVGTVQDITARKAMERALRDSEERFRMFLEHAADAILIGRQGTIVELNGRACELTGYSRDELLGANIRVIFAPAELDRAPLRYDRLERGEAVTSERLLARKDGGTVPVEMHTSRMPDGTDQAILRDISDRRRLESQLQLRQRMDSIGTLAGGIAHDFNNILVAIQGYADVLHTDAPELTPSSRGAVEQVRTASQRAADLVRRLRSLTEPEARPGTTFDLHMVVSDVFQMLEETTDRRIRKACGIEPDAWFVRGSDSDMFHALVNLGLNAIQAIELKGVCDDDVVRAAASAYDAAGDDAFGLAPGRYVHLSVSDTGTGMSPEVRDRAFDPLFTTKDKGDRKGQGLGLTMVYNTVVTQHGGAISVETQEGQGSTFHLFLPLGPRPAVKAVPSAGDAPPVVAGVILVVEDEAQIASLATHVLGRLGYQVLVARDGVEAMEVFERHAAAIDLVILDQTLPRLSGLEVLGHVLRARPGMRIILSSGNATVVPAEAVGARLLPKPYGLDDLRAAVRDALRDQPPEDGPRRN